MTDRRSRVVVLGLSLSSSWGNGHATTYRALLSGLAARGHDVLFLERDVPWYAAHRDLCSPDFCRLVLYDDPEQLWREHGAAVRDAGAVIVGSYVPDGIEVIRRTLSAARGVTAFYDIDTPVTLESLTDGSCAYLTADLIPGFDLYFSFTGGPTLRRLEAEFGARAARPLYCCVDPERYFPEDEEPTHDLGYLGTYSDDRQPMLDRLLIEPARRAPDLRFVVAGPQYPASIDWPANVERVEHLPPAEHRRFYTRQRFTLNVTRRAMTALGWSPSVRLFEAAACGTPVVSDRWPGLDAIFRPDAEIFLAATADDVLARLRSTDDARRRAIGRAARTRVLAEHTSGRRAAELEGHLLAARERSVAAGPVR